MYEYIKRTDAIAEINRGDLLVGNCAEWAREIIWRCPYSDVKEVKHGRWIWKDGKCFCSACAKQGEPKQVYQDGTVDEYPYCPNCGAKMDTQ